MGMVHEGAVLPDGELVLESLAGSDGRLIQAAHAAGYFVKPLTPQNIAHMQSQSA